MVDSTDDAVAVAARSTDLDINGACRTRVVLKQVLQVIDGEPELSSIASEVRAVARSANEPLRVALAGDIKVGKSTLINALLGSDVVATGDLETTYHVTRIRHGNTPELRVRYRDGRRSPPLDPSRFREAACHDGGSQQQGASDLNAVRLVEVRHPAHVLRQMELIDTPGLHSWYQDDSQNTLDFFGLDQSRSERESSGPSGMPVDAYVYLFSRNLAQSDASLLKRLAEDPLGRVHRMNAIGVLSKVDLACSGDASGELPLEAGNRVIRRLRGEHDVVNRVFADVVPVAGKLAAGAWTMTCQDLQTLHALAELDADTFERLTVSNRRFAQSHIDGVVSAEDRQHLIERLGMYGVVVACNAIRRAPGLTERLVRDALFNASGVANIREILQDRFGRRTHAIRLCGLWQRIQSLAARHEASWSRRARFGWQRAQQLLTQFLYKDPTVFSVQLLHRYYAGQLDIDDELADELLVLSGEQEGPGGNLSPVESYTYDEARLAKWRRVLARPLLSGDMRQTARFAVHALEHGLRRALR